MEFGAIKEEYEKRFMELLDIVENGYRVLSRMKDDSELSNTKVISIIEEKLPKTILKDKAEKSVKKVVKRKNQTNFLHFLNFF